MSRGLGKLQLAILATLDEAKRKQTRYVGHDYDYFNEICYHGRTFVLPDHIYDLRASSRYLACALGRVRTGLSQRVSTIATPSFKAAFSRAVRGLVKSGYLKLATYPRQRGPDWCPERRADMRLITRGEKQILPDSANMINAYAAFQEREREQSRRRHAAWAASHPEFAAMVAAGNRILRGRGK